MVEDNINERISVGTLTIAGELYIRAIDKIAGNQAAAIGHESEDLLDSRARLFMARVNACLSKGEAK